MAGTWLSIVEGFGGMRVRDDKLNFTPQIPDHWDSYSFKVNFRGQILKVNVSKDGSSYELQEGTSLDIVVNGEPKTVSK